MKIVESMVSDYAKNRLNTSNTGQTLPECNVILKDKQVLNTVQQ